MYIDSAHRLVNLILISRAVARSVAGVSSKPASLYAITAITSLISPIHEKCIDPALAFNLKGENRSIYSIPTPVLLRLSNVRTTNDNIIAYINIYLENKTEIQRFFRLITHCSNSVRCFFCIQGE